MVQLSYFASPWSVLACIAVLFMCFVFILAQVKKNNGLVDIAWGLIAIILTFSAYLLYALPSLHQQLMTATVFAWGLRLSIHIFLRNWRKPEDFRYAAWREKWSRELGRLWVIRAFFQIFILQGLLSLVLVSPVLWVHFYGGGEVNGVVIFGALAWLIGFFFESLGDYQLNNFVLRKKKGELKEGSIMTDGLWRFTRHPNYFGEVLQWWGVWIMALSAPNAWITVVSPLLISFLILYVSGIPMLEKKYEHNPAFQAYRARTSAFLPWFPKKTNS